MKKRTRICAIIVLSILFVFIILAIILPEIIQGNLKYNCIGNICIPIEETPLFTRDGEGIGIQFSEMNLNVYYNKDEYKTKNKQKYISKLLKEKKHIKKYSLNHKITVLKYQDVSEESEKGQEYTVVIPYYKLLINGDVYTFIIDEYEENKSNIKKLDGIIKKVKLNNTFYDYTQYSDNYHQEQNEGSINIPLSNDLKSLPSGGYLYKYRNAISIDASNNCSQFTTYYSDVENIDASNEDLQYCNSEYKFKDEYAKMLSEKENKYNTYTTYKELLYYETNNYNIIQYYATTADEYDFKYANVYNLTYMINPKGTSIVYNITGEGLSGKKDENYKEVDTILKSITIKGEEWSK